MADVVVNGNEINTEQAEHTFRDASTSEFIYLNTYDDLNHNQQRELYNLGVEIQELISEHTYMCHYRQSDLDALRRLSFIRTANVYETEMKTVRSLKSVIAATPQKILKIEVLIHDDAPLSLIQLAQEMSRKTGISVTDMVIGGTRVSLSIAANRIAELEKIDAVNRIEEYQEDAIPSNTYVRGILAQDWDHTSYGHAKDYFRYKGKGQIVTVADTGLDTTHPAFTNKIVRSDRNIWNTEYENIDDLSTAKPKRMWDTNGHGTHVAGSVVEGVATECKIIPQNMWYIYKDKKDGKTKGSMSAYNDPEYLYQEGFQDGSRIHSNSWGPTWTKPDTDEHYTQIGYALNATAVDRVAHRNQEQVILFSGGNDGGKKGYSNEVNAQNGAKNVITVGNCLTMRPTNYGGYANSANISPDPKRMQWTSSCGPTLPAGNQGGRIKPDVVAPGTAVLSARSRDVSQEAIAENQKGNGVHWDDNYQYLTGTSMSTPHVAGCCAVIREALMSPTGAYMRSPSAHLIKALLINGAVDLKGHLGNDWKTPIREVPSTWQGFGRVDLSNSLLNIDLFPINGRGNSIPGNTAPGTGFTDAGNPMTFWPRGLTSESSSWYMNNIPFNQKVFRATLVYPDPAGEILQNNLNLIVRCGNEERHGNMGTSSNYDYSNNVEKVVWENPPANTISIEVYARRITKLEGVQNFACAWMSTHC